MIKPDGVQRGLIGEIIKRFEQKGYKLLAMKLTAPGKGHMVSLLLTLLTYHITLKLIFKSPCCLVV